MSNEHPRGFTTAILHSDRDATIEHGALHKPLHLSVAYGYRDARELAAVFQGKASGYAYGRQGNPTSTALEAKVNAMEDGVGTVTFATGMAAIGAIMLALLKGGDHIVASQFVFGNTSSLLLTLEGHGHPVSFVDATDVANVAAAITPATRVVFVETIANPRVQVADLKKIGDLCRERGILYVVDNTMTSPWLFQPQARRREPRRQRADQVHRRPRQRAGGQHHRHRPLRLDEVPEHRGRLQVAAAAQLGAAAAAQEGPARLGRHAGGGTGASHRGRRRDAGAADGADLRQCTGARRVAAAAAAGARRLLSGARARIRSTRWPAQLFRAYGGLLSFELRRRPSTRSTS